MTTLSFTSWSQYYPSSAAYVHYVGSLSSYHVYSGVGCVRPALWVDLGSEFFSSADVEMFTKASDDETEISAGIVTSAGASTEDSTHTENKTASSGTNDVDDQPASDVNDAASARDAMFAVGNTVTFATYPQTAAGTDSTPIEWIVLARDGQKALLLSRYGLDAKTYNTKYVDITWEKCSLRKWLNSDFLNKAFTSDEQADILRTNVDNGKSQGYMPAAQGLWGIFAHQFIHQFHTLLWWAMYWARPCLGWRHGP